MKPIIVSHTISVVALGIAILCMVRMNNIPKPGPIVSTSCSCDGYVGLIADCLQSSVNQGKDLEECKEDLKTCQEGVNPNCTDDSCDVR